MRTAIWSLIFSLCLSTTSWSATKKEPVRNWQEGKLTDITRREATTGTVNVFLGDVDAPRIVFEYTVVVAGHFYVGERRADTYSFASVQKDKPPIDLEINGPVKVAIDGNKMYLVDPNGKEQVLLVIKHGIKEDK